MINFNILHLIIFLFILLVARVIMVFLHEVGHWIVIGFKGKIMIKWIPWPHGEVSRTIKFSSKDKLSKKIHVFLVKEAGCIVNITFAALVVLFLPSINLTSWIHVFIFSLGFVGLLGTAFNIGWGSDNTSVFHLFGVHKFLPRLIIGLVLAALLIYLFREYYVINFLKILMNL